MNFCRILTLGTVAFLGAIASEPALAQAWPTGKPITMVVPFPPGPALDLVARLVGTDHFEIANNGAPISVTSNPSTRPDITFSGNTPYVSWRENTGGSIDKGFVGHFFLSNGVPMFQR